MKTMCEYDQMQQKATVDDALLFAVPQLHDRAVNQRYQRGIPRLIRLYVFNILGFGPKDVLKRSQVSDVKLPDDAISVTTEMIGVDTGCWPAMIFEELLKFLHLRYYSTGLSRFCLKYTSLCNHDRYISHMNKFPGDGCIVPHLISMSSRRNHA